MVAANASTPLAMMGDAMPKAPPWVATSYAGTCPPSLTWDIWAPSVLRIGGRYVLYFAGRNASTGMFCLGTATAPTLDQAFTAQPAPLYCNSRFWSIDPNPVTIGSSLYLVFRTDDAANLRGKIVSRRLRADGLAFYSSADPLITLLTGTESWEEGDPSAPGIGPIENPSMALLPATGALPGQWILTYSANNWATNDYATGLATCAGPAGPCTKVSKAAPWLNNSASPSVATGTSARFGGAGGFFLVTDSAGAPQGVFAAYADYHAAPTAPRQMFTYQLTRPGVNPSLTSAERVDVTMPAPTGVVAVAGVASTRSLGVRPRSPAMPPGTSSRRRRGR